jgi:hypothetical protein
VNEPSLPPGAPKKSNTLVIVLMVVGGLFVVIVGVVGVVAAVGIHGARTYVSKAKGSEGRVSVGALARSVATCGENENLDGSSGLPPSTTWVPATLAEVSGKKFQSGPTDWKQPGFECGNFMLTMPQYFQYRWERVSATEGVARAQADIDGDGTAEAVFEAKVTCASGSCTPGPVVGGPSP